MEYTAEKIRALKAEKDAVILAHYYAPDEAQAVADYVGDSFYLAKAATETRSQTIVFCGVHFMGESAKILNPSRRVLMPDLTADCAMAHMATEEQIKKTARRGQGPCRGLLHQFDGAAQKPFGRVRHFVERGEDRARAARKKYIVYTRPKLG